VLEENEVAIREGRDAIDEAVERVGEFVLVRVFELRCAILLRHRFALGVLFGRAVEPPVFLGEWEIGAYAVELANAPVVIQELWVLNCILAFDLRIEAMQEHVDVGNGPGVPNGFLAEEADAPCVAALFFHELGGVNREAAGAGGGVVERRVRLRLDEADDDVADFRGRIELAGGGPRLVFVGELLDQVFVGIAQHVRGDVGIVEQDGIEIVDRTGYDLRVQLLLAAAVRRCFIPADGIDDAFEGRVAVGDGVYRLVEFFIFVLQGGIAHVLPEAHWGNDEGVAFFLKAK
jgi:hypothetical protein